MSVRLITRPYSKLTRLCAEAAKGGGALTTFAMVAKALNVTPGRVTQIFGYAKEADGITPKPETVGLLVAVFRRDGVGCEIEWLYLDYDDFAARLTKGQQAKRSEPEPDWELSADTVLPDLVELRLHPPRPANEIKDSYYVDTTLLFGTAICDLEPKGTEEPRSVSIALRAARLTIGSDGYQPLPGTMLGELGREARNYARVA